MLSFGLVEGDLRLVDGLLSALAFLLSGGLFPLALELAPFLLFFINPGGLSSGLVVRFA